jgi:hypothetical protein
VVPPRRPRARCLVRKAARQIASTASWVKRYNDRGRRGGEAGGRGQLGEAGITTDPDADQFDSVLLPLCPHEPNTQAGNGKARSKPRPDLR